MKRAGFTMIELIFVIVILGILAAVAIPKLSAVKDDAKIATTIQSFCSDAIKSKLNTSFAMKGTIDGVDMGAMIDLPTGYTLSDSDGLINVTDGGVNDFNSSAQMTPTFENTNASIFVYYMNGSGDILPSCFVSNTETTTNTGVKAAKALAKGESIF